MNGIHLSAFKKPALRAMFVILCGSLVLGCSGERSEQYQLQGDSYYRLNKFDEAEEAYQNAIDSNPENVRALLGLGRCRIALHKPNEALVLFEEATLIDPQFELVILSLNESHAYLPLSVFKVQLNSMDRKMMPMQTIHQ